MEEITACDVWNDPEIKTDARKRYKINSIKSSSYSQNLFILDNKNINPLSTQINHMLSQIKRVATDEICTVFFKLYLTEIRIRINKRENENNDTKELLLISHS